ncbi:PAS domain S-box protein [Chitinophaga sancti]|uniref:histidine kinase n=1 Tax=Chitinophaga sancti TaxID=1004 RepID=A0A1K1SP19_9BACT|nr:PAS domain S-box protein [Chitinophaga sancti]WQD60093.1 PAS domain S-box protein [Chitinophaga sancti]WQG87779.1 PAS domain S-box protein [Chitinophaga sancti]SFW85629.1 PAS domain S-box-containing protein [Chitinophaga sancti]
MHESSPSDQTAQGDQEIQQIKTALHAVGIGIWDIDILQGKVTLDTTCKELFGLPPVANITYDMLLGSLHPADRQLVRESVRKLMQKQNDNSINLRFRTADIDNRSLRWLQVKGQIYFTPDGQVSRLSGIAMDITNEIAANEKAEAAERLSAIAIEGSGAGSFTIDFASDTITYSPSLAHMITGERTGGSHFRDIFLPYVHPEDRKIREQAYEEAMDTGILNYECRFIWKDGSIHWVKIKGKYYYDPTGRPESFSGIGLDVTESRERTRLLKEVEQRFLLAFNNSSISMAFLDKNGVIQEVNKAFAGFLGYTQQELSGMHYRSIVQADYRKENDKLFSSLAHGEQEFYNQIKQYYHKDGGVRWVQVNIASVAMEEANSTHILAIAFDIGNEVAVRKEQQQLLSLVENSNDLIMVSNLDGNVTYINEAGVHLLGLPNKAAAVTHPMKDFFEPVFYEQVKGSIIPELMREGKWTGRQTYQHQETGEALPFMTNAFRLDSPMSGKPIAVAGVARDLRTELETQKALKESENRFRSLVEEAPVPTALYVGRELIIEVANDAMLSLWDRGNIIIGQPLTRALPELHGHQFLDIMDEIFNTGEVFHGREMPVELISNGSRALMYLNITFKPLQDPQGEVYAILNMAIDVTQQVVAKNKILENQSFLESEVLERTEELAASNEELAAMNEELQEANMHLVRSNQELEQYAYVASHDLQEPLRKIRIYADLLAKKNDLNIEHKRLVDKINQSSERMSMLIKDLLEFSRLLETGNMLRDVDLTELLLMVSKDFELIIEEKKARINIGKLPVIQGVPLQMNQLFYNLMSNALKFTQEGITPVIEIQAHVISLAEAANYLRMPEQGKQYYDISFRDNGIGFDNKYAEQIFEVFKRLHNRNQYPGSGIGLSLCRRIVGNHGGHMYVLSAPDEGTIFHIILPGKQITG